MNQQLTNGASNSAKPNSNLSAHPSKPFTFVRPIPNDTSYIAVYDHPESRYSQYEGVAINPMTVVGIVPAGANISAFHPIQHQHQFLAPTVLGPNQLYAVQTSLASKYALPPQPPAQKKAIRPSNQTFQSRISPQTIFRPTASNESGPRLQHPPTASRSFPLDLSKIPSSSTALSLRPPLPENQSIPPSYDATIVALQSGQAVVRSARSKLRNKRSSPSSTSSTNSPHPSNEALTGSVTPSNSSSHSGGPIANQSQSQEPVLAHSVANVQPTRGTNAIPAMSVRPRSDSVGASRTPRRNHDEEARRKKLADVAQQLADLKLGLRDLRRSHVRMKEEADESLLAFRRTMRTLLVDLPAAARTPLRRERLTVEQELCEIRRDQNTTLSTLRYIQTHTLWTHTSTTDR